MFRSCEFGRRRARVLLSSKKTESDHHVPRTGTWCGNSGCIYYRRDVRKGLRGKGYARQCRSVFTYTTRVYYTGIHGGAYPYSRVSCINTHSQLAYFLLPPSPLYTHRKPTNKPTFDFVHSFDWSPASHAHALKRTTSPPLLLLYHNCYFIIFF